MAPLALVAVAAGGVAAGVVVDRVVKRRLEDVDDYHEVTFDDRSIPVAPNPPFGN